VGEKLREEKNRIHERNKKNGFHFSSVFRFTFFPLFFLSLSLSDQRFLSLSLSDQRVLFLSLSVFFSYARNQSSADDRTLPSFV
jgi:hypothetical protein